MSRILARLILAAVPLAGGCARGTMPWLAEKHPQKTASGSWGLFGGSFDVFANDGTNLHVGKLILDPDTGKVIGMENVALTDKSEELTVLSNQMMTQKMEWQLQQQQITQDFILGLVPTIADPFLQWKAAHPSSSKDPNIVKGILTTLLNQAIAGQQVGLLPGLLPAPAASSTSPAAAPGPVTGPDPSPLGSSDSGS